MGRRSKKMRRKGVEKIRGGGGGGGGIEGRSCKGGVR